MIALVASVVTAATAAALAVRLALRYAARRHLYTLLYAVALALAAVAAGCDLTARVAGTWPEAGYRLYWFSAGGLVGIMGAASALLTARHSGPVGRWVGWIAGALAGLLTLWLLYATATMPVAGDALAVSDATFTRAPAAARLPFIWTSSAGAVLIFGGALISWWQTRQRYPLLIALGAVLFSLGGTAAGLGGASLFYTCQTLGSLALYAGVAGAQPVRPAAGVPARP